MKSTEIAKKEQMRQVAPARKACRSSIIEDWPVWTDKTKARRVIMIFSITNT